MLANNLAGLNGGAWFGLAGDNGVITLHFREPLNRLNPQSVKARIEWLMAMGIEWRETLTELQNPDEEAMADDDPPPSGGMIIRG